MNIDLGNNYRLSGNKHDYIVEQRVIRNQGKANEHEDWKQLGFFSDMSKAITWLAQMRIRTSSAESLAEALEEVKAIADELRAALSPIFEVRVK